MNFFQAIKEASHGIFFFHNKKSYLWVASECHIYEQMKIEKIITFYTRAYQAPFCEMYGFYITFGGKLPRSFIPEGNLMRLL